MLERDVEISRIHEFWGSNSCTKGLISIIVGKGDWCFLKEGDNSRGGRGNYDNISGDESCSKLFNLLPFCRFERSLSFQEPWFHGEGGKGGGRGRRRGRWRKVKRTRQHCVCERERGEGRAGMNKRMRRYASRNMRNGVKIAEDRQNRSILIIEQRTKYQKPKYFPVSNAHCPRDPS